MYYCLDKSGLMIQFKSPDAPHCKGILNVKNCRIYKAKFKDANGDYIYGLNIMGRKDNQDFYSYQEKDIDEWYDHLIPMCVLLDLHSTYVRMNKIGKGNFATVYKYKRKSDDKMFAVKSLEKRKIMESKRKRDSNPLLSEIDIMRSCDHSGVIKLYEVYEADKHVHLVMEVLDGGELFNRIRNKGTYTEADAIKVTRNILEALAYLHDKGIVHRDLKPENLILAGNEDDYNVKIADFGLATFVQPGEKLDLPCGSPGYVAFELLQDPSPGYDTKADIFSVGVIVYILLTGRPAFHGADYKQILAKNKQGDPPYPKRFWNKISEHGQDLVKSMLQKDQNLRLSAREALQHPWFDEEGKGEILDDVIENFKDLQEYEPPSKVNPADASNPLLTVTPVMAGRHLKDTCESPWNPSGFTPKMDPKTPLLRHGFDTQPKRNINIPGIGVIGGGAQEAKEEEKKQANNNLGVELDPFKKFEMMQQQRKQKNPQATMNFGVGPRIDISKKAEALQEEAKIDPVTNAQVDPKDSEKPSLADRIDNTPETKPFATEKRVKITDAEVNIKDEDLRECPPQELNSIPREGVLRSFKPGVATDNRFIPTTPGDNKQVSMCEKNRPLKRIKDALMKVL